MKSILNLFIFVSFGTLLIFVGCGGGGGGGGNSTQINSTPTQQTTQDIKSSQIQNRFANITSQCYTKTKDINGKTHNPCFSCHTKGVAPNYIDDSALQEEYIFPEEAMKNAWTNVLKDRTAAVASVSDAEILSYISANNYMRDGKITLAEKLKNLPNEWDFDSDGKWGGYMPDCYFSFDAEGFDKDPGGNYTGWRSFAYYPFLGTFWPTNGSTDDVLIRLGEKFRSDESGRFSLEVYKTNLAIVESLIHQKDVAIEPIDESKYGVDLDKDGKLATASIIKYEWAPLSGKNMSYIGAAKKALENGEVHLAARLYPETTEMLHTVRYIGIDGNEIKMANRLKELRYAKKTGWSNYTNLQNYSLAENQEAMVNPDAPVIFLGDMEYGFSNKQGWIYQGFIEDKEGELRPQSAEEHLFCMGCHANLGATTDGTFAFPRKFDASSHQRGWYHWTQKGFQGIKEPKINGVYEYTRYLTLNGAGDEFRENTEVMSKFFESNGSLKESEITKLHDDISHLLLPTRERALSLNKAYREIVKEQSFIYGRDATLSASKSVHAEITETATGLIAQ